MPWNSLSNLAASDVVVENDMDDLRENIEWLGQLQAATVALSSLNAISMARVAVGSYTGNGVDNRWITGVGFTPQWVVIQRSTTSLQAYSTSAMPADNSGIFGVAALVANYIQSFNSDGFQVGADNYVNGSTFTYYWIAIG